jgi:hypothetical protein
MPSHSRQSFPVFAQSTSHFDEHIKQSHLFSGIHFLGVRSDISGTGLDMTRPLKQTLRTASLIEVR